MVRAGEPSRRPIPRSGRAMRSEAEGRQKSVWIAEPRLAGGSNARLARPTPRAHICQKCINLDSGFSPCCKTPPRRLAFRGNGGSFGCFVFSVSQPPQSAALAGSDLVGLGRGRLRRVHRLDLSLVLLEDDTALQLERGREFLRLCDPLHRQWRTCEPTPPGRCGGCSRRLPSGPQHRDRQALITCATGRNCFRHRLLPRYRRPSVSHACPWT
jgi:hypothetical protein